MAAVKLEALLRGIVADFPHVAVDTALVPLGQVVDSPAEGRVPPKQIDVSALRVQNVGGQPSEDFQVGNQLAQLLLIKQGIHTNTSHCEDTLSPVHPDRRQHGGTPMHLIQLLAVLVYNGLQFTPKRASISATSLNWVRQRSRFCPSRLMWK